MSPRIISSAVLVCTLLIGTGIVFAQKAEEAKPTVNLKDIPDDTRKAIDKAAPGVRWKQAKFDKAYQDVKGRLVEIKELVVSGQDKKGRDVTVKVQDRTTISIAFVTLSAQDLPKPVRDAMLQRASLGKWLEVTAVGETTEKPYEYSFVYSSGGLMVISPDGNKVETFGFTEQRR